MKHLALIGLGQLGGSIAIAAKEALPEMHIRGFDAVTAHGEYLLARGLIDTHAASIVDAVQGADMVLLACPLRSYDEVAAAMQTHLLPHTIVTDIGSVKCTMQRVAAALPHHAIVPGHPIAGGEKTGPHVAREGLFAGKLQVLTPLPQTTPEAMESVAQFWEALGATIMEMPVEVHDQIYAHVSHLPHAVAFVAAHYFALANITLTHEDATLQQFLRIGRSGARMWCDVFLENHLALLPPLATLIALLEHFVKELTSNSEPTQAVADTAVLKTHLPRILAGSLISTVSLYEQQAGFDVRRFAAGGLRDVAAPAATAPEDALAEMSAHAAFLAEHTAAIIPHFRTLEARIGAQDSGGLYALLETMRLSAEALHQEVQ